MIGKISIIIFCFFYLLYSEQTANIIIPANHRINFFSINDKSDTYKKNDYSLFSKVGKEYLYVLKTPARFELSDLLWLVPAGAVLGATIRYDVELNSWYRKIFESQLDSEGSFYYSDINQDYKWRDYIYRFAQWYTDVGSAYFMLGVAGVLGVYDKEKGDQAATLLIENSIVTAGYIGISKYIFSASRPWAGRDEHVWFDRKISSKGFPSGHTMYAFSCATVLDEVYDKPYLFYTMAALVGFSRIRLEKHWFSDVVCGAIFGHIIGRQILNFNREMFKDMDKTVSLSPTENGLQVKLDVKL